MDFYSYFRLQEADLILILKSVLFFSDLDLFTILYFYDI